MMLVQHCIHGIQMFCVYWDALPAVVNRVSHLIRIILFTARLRVFMCIITENVIYLVIRVGLIKTVISCIAFIFSKSSMIIKNIHCANSGRLYNFTHNETHEMRYRG